MYTYVRRSSTVYFIYYWFFVHSVYTVLVYILLVLHSVCSYIYMYGNTFGSISVLLEVHVHTFEGTSGSITTV